MEHHQYSFGYEVYDNIHQLNEEDSALLSKAFAVTEKAYAPYSHFFVGTAALLQNREIVTGTNQENASYPVGICAERVLLSTVSSLYPGVAIKTMAITYQNKNTCQSNTPIAPCGICRQSLREYEERFQQPIRLILGGREGQVIVIEKSSSLLPLSFTGDALK